jgi:hypothetical protein
MRFHKKVAEVDRQRILRAIGDIKKHGAPQHIETAEFIEQADVLIYVGPADEVGGSGSVAFHDVEGVIKAIKSGNLTSYEAARYIKLNLARETIDTGGQQGIEGTFVHEGKHLRDFARMVESFSAVEDDAHFDPTGFQLELSAHMTSAFYMLRRGGAFIDEALSLGLLEKNGEKVSVSDEGIRNRLKNNYGLSEATPGPRVSERFSDRIKPRRKKFLGLI